MPILFGNDEEKLYEIEEKLQNKAFDESDSEESLKAEKTELKSKGVISRLKVKV